MLQTEESHSLKQQKGQRYRSDFQKKCHFHHFFSFFSKSLLFFEIQFKVHEWGKLFLHSLSLFMFIFCSFLFIYLIFFVRKEVVLLCFSFNFPSLKSIRREPFCLASVAFGTAFPGHWSGSCSGALRRRCQYEPCPWKHVKKQTFRIEDSEKQTLKSWSTWCILQPSRENWADGLMAASGILLA